MFKEPRPEPRFSWADLETSPPAAPTSAKTSPWPSTRLLQYTLRDHPDLRPRGAASRRTVRQGRSLAGFHFCKNILDPALNPNEFLAALQQKLRSFPSESCALKGRFRKATFTLTVAEELDCSGLPCSEETVCQYDEGFIAGRFRGLHGKPFTEKRSTAGPAATACAASSQTKMMAVFAQQISALLEGKSRPPTPRRRSPTKRPACFAQKLNAFLPACRNPGLHRPAVPGPASRGQNPARQLSRHRPSRPFMPDCSTCSAGRRGARGDYRQRVDFMGGFFRGLQLDGRGA